MDRQDRTGQDRDRYRDISDEDSRVLGGGYIVGYDFGGGEKMRRGLQEERRKIETREKTSERRRRGSRSPAPGHGVCPSGSQAAVMMPRLGACATTDGD